MPRKRKKAPRTKSGRISRAYKTIARDCGTLELQAKRRALVGDYADPALSASATGILFAHGYIDRAQYDKALVYRSAHAAVWGSTWPTNNPGPEATLERAAALRSHLAKLERHITQDQRNVLSDLACRDFIPHWFVAERLNRKPLAEHKTARQLLLAALDSMVDQDTSQPTYAGT